MSVLFASVLVYVVQYLINHSQATLSAAVSGRCIMHANADDKPAIVFLEELMKLGKDMTVTPELFQVMKTKAMATNPMADGSKDDFFNFNF